VGGHSTRVGAPQDLAELDIDLAAITRDVQTLVSRSATGRRKNLPHCTPPT